MMANCPSQCSSTSSALLSQGAITIGQGFRNHIPAQNSKSSPNCSFSAMAAHNAASNSAVTATVDGVHRHHNYQHYRYSMSDDDSGCVLDEYGWVPPGLTPDIIHSYFAVLPEHKVPYVSSAGEQWRLEQMERQLPAQDSDPRYCGYLSAAETNELRAFAEARKKHCMGRGQILRLPYVGQKVYCHQCKETINADEVAITTSDNLEGGSSPLICWHPKCFVCVECKELLVDLIYFQHNQNVFCGRHHAEQIKPRCAGCDELIFSEECTEAEGRVWHIKHFVCGSCGGALGGQRYITCGAANGAENVALPLCIPCYEGDAQLKCNTCGTSVRGDRPHITQGDINWHADARCFCCCICSENLLGKRYSFANRRLFCGLDATCMTTKSARLVLPPPNFAALIAPKTSNTALAGSTTIASSKTPCEAQLSTFIADSARQKPPPPQRFPRPPSLSPPPPPPSCPLPAIPSANMGTPNTSPTNTVACNTPPENIYETVMTVSASRVASKNAAPLLKTFSDAAIPAVKPCQANGENSPLRSASAIFSPPFSSPTASSSSSPSAASASSLQRRRLEMEERQRKSRYRSAQLSAPFAPPLPNAMANTAIPDQNANYKQHNSQPFTCTNQPLIASANYGCFCEKNMAAQKFTRPTNSCCCNNENIVVNPALSTNVCCDCDKTAVDNTGDSVVADKVIMSNVNSSSIDRSKRKERYCDGAMLSQGEIAPRRRRQKKRERSRRRFRSTCSLESVGSSCSSIASSSSTSSALSDQAATSIKTRMHGRRRLDDAIDYDSASSGAEADLLAEYLSHAALLSTRQSANMGRRDCKMRARSADGRRQKHQHRRLRSRDGKTNVPHHANLPSRMRFIAANDSALALHEECTLAAKANCAPAQQMRFQNFYSKMPPENICASHRRGNSSTRRQKQRRRGNLLRETKHASLRSGYFSASTTSTSSSASESDAEDERVPMITRSGFRTQIPLGVDALKQYRPPITENSQRKFKQRRQKFRPYALISSQSSQDLESMNTAAGALASPKAIGARFRPAQMNTAKLSKNKSNSNCIVS